MKRSSTYYSLSNFTNAVENPIDEVLRSCLESRSGEESTGNDSEEGAPEKAGFDQKNRFKPALGFHVNKSGFPINDWVWNKMWQNVQSIHPDGFTVMKKIRGNTTLPRLPIPNLPSFTYSMDVQTKLDLVQGYLLDLRYNHTGTQFFEIRKNRPLRGLMETAKEMIRESLPIKCLEATILSVYLTNGICGLQRFTIGFKTQIHVGAAYLSHVVLGVHYGGKFGALGLSRRDDLMYKPLKFKSLCDLIENFKQSYNRYFHVLKRVKLSLPIVHDPHSYEHIHWKYLTINMEKLDKEQIVKILERYSREIKTITAGWSNSAQVTGKKDMLY